MLCMLCRARSQEVDMGRMLGRDRLPCYYQDHGNGTVSYWEEAACDGVIKGEGRRRRYQWGLPAVLVERSGCLLLRGGEAAPWCVRVPAAQGSTSSPPPTRTSPNLLATRGSQLLLLQCGA